MDSDPIKRRDQGLRRVTRIGRAVLAGGVVATGALSAVATHSATTSSTVATVPDPGVSSTPSTSTSADQLQAPITTPKVSRAAPGHATTGGS